MKKLCLPILLFLLPCTLLPGQDAVCGHKWLSERQDSASSLRVAYAYRLLDSLARSALVEHRAEIVIPVVVHVVWQKPAENISYNLGRVAVHEAGHYFGLLHLWGDDEDCATDDGVADTPPQLAPYKGCPAYPQTSCGNANMFMNFMDYVDDECLVMFTKGQMNRVLNTVEAFRPGLALANVSCVRQGGKEPETVFMLSPNPSSGIVKVNFKNNLSEIGKVEMFNPVGQKVFHSTNVLFDGMQLDFQNHIAGVYFVKIGYHLEKLIIK
jgi:hypothetical protein